MVITAQAATIRPAACTDDARMPEVTPDAGEMHYELANASRK
jgi:hypothetical protein